MMEDDPSLIQKVRIDLIKEQIARSEEHGNSLTKWYVASLLVINGSALISLMDIEKSKPGTIVSSGWPFGLSLALALISGLMMSAGNAFFAANLADRLWNGEVLQEKKFTDIFSGPKSRGASGAVGLILSMISAIVFVFGCYNFAEHRIEGSEVSNSNSVSQ